MPKNYYSGWTIDELIAERRSIQERLSGGSITESGAASVRVAVEYEGSARDALMRVEYALWVIDPDNYTNPYTESATRTRPAFHTLTAN